MKIHEYQAKELLRKFGVSTPNGAVLSAAWELNEILDRIGGEKWVVKAQIHAGGRGKGGGVKVVGSREEAREAVDNILGMQLVTPQTGAAGTLVHKVYVEEASDIKKEYYLGVVPDRASRKIVMMGSAEGGMAIEEVARDKPEAIKKEEIDIAVGFQAFQARRLALSMGIPKEALASATSFMSSLYRCFIATDASLAEINPLVLTGDNKIVAVDAKINFDDCGLFRHKELFDLRDIAEEDPREVEASKYNLSYISLDGNIGCMINGAGLAMATMDIIKLHGGEPANFLDVGGGASLEKVCEAFNIILGDSKVKAILVNIFGGIMLCDVIAEGIIQAASETGLSVPLVVRLEGTNVEMGRKILAESSLKIISAETMDEAAKKVVAAAGGRS